MRRDNSRRGKTVERIEFGRSNAVGYENDKVQEEREPLLIKNKTPLEFDAISQSMLIDTVELSRRINRLFRNSGFNEIRGTNISVLPDGSLTVDLFCLDKGEGALVRVQDRIKQARGLEQIASIGQTGRIFELSQNLKDIVVQHSYIPGGRKNINKINWNERTAEVHDRPQTLYQTGEVYVKIMGLSVEKLIQTLYGNVDSNGKPCEYSVSIVRPLPSSYPAVTYLLNVTRIDPAEVNKIASKIGIGVQTTGIPMVTEI